MSYRSQQSEHVWVCVPTIEPYMWANKHVITRRVKSKFIYNHISARTKCDHVWDGWARAHRHLKTTSLYWRLIFMLCGQNDKTRECVGSSTFHPSRRGAEGKTAGQVPALLISENESLMVEADWSCVCVSACRAYERKWRELERTQRTGMDKMGKKVSRQRKQKKPTMKCEITLIKKMIEKPERTCDLLPHNQISFLLL